jgi:hypothetical protein
MVTLHDIPHLLAYIGGVPFLFGAFVILPLMWPITGRYFDNHVGLKKSANLYAETSVLTPKALTRTLEYALLIVFRRGTKRSAFSRAMFGDMDFREKARTIDKVLAFSFVIIFYSGFAILGIGALMAGLLKLFS